MNSPNAKQPLRSLSAADIYEINEQVTERVPFVRDHRVLHATVQRPYLVLFGEAQFPTILDKAAATLHAIAAHHIFADGNKRTAVRATQLFLEANGWRATWTMREIQAFVLEIAQGQHAVDDVASWLAQYTETDNQCE